MSPGGSHENRHPGLPRSPSRSLVIGAAGAERTIRQRLRKLQHTPAESGSKASSAETYGATDQQGDVSQGAQNMRESAFENLPEDILHHIHSLLHVQDAARAACVSRVFLRSWRCYSNLVLCHQTLGWNEKKYGEREIKFMGKVDKILENHYRNGVKLKTLYLILHPYKNVSASYLDRWLQNAVKSGIEELSLILYPVIEENSYSFPCSVLSDKAAASSIQDLRLFYCAFHPTSALGCLKRLKSLNLCEVHITEEGLGHLLSKSFVLERIVVSSCSRIICLRIPFTLQHLKLICIRTCEMLQVVEIDAPKVCTFHYSGSPQVKISVRNPSQLKNVDMCSYNRSAPGILSYARASLTSIAPNVESLTLHSRKENVDTRILPFKLIHLKKLEIGVLKSVKTSSPSYDAFSVVSFLDASPVLDSFVLWVERYAVIQDPVVRDDEKYSRRKPECRYDSLRQVTIAGFSSAKSLVELTIHILESARSLERLTLDTATDYSRRSRCCCASREIGQRLPMSERALAEAQSAVEAAGRYIAGRVPSGVKFEVLEPPSRCHTGNL